MKRITRPVGRLLSSGRLWRILFLPLVLVAGFTAFTLYTNGSTPGAKYVTVLNSGNMQQVQTDTQAAMQAGKPVFFELCTGDICTEQVAELDKVAADYKDKILFVQVNPVEVPDLAQAAAAATGKIAFPTHFLVGPNGEYAETGLLSAEQLKQFIDSSLNSKLVKLTASNEQQVQKSLQSSRQSVLYVVCTPDICKTLTPVLEQAAVTYKGKVTIVVVDATSGSSLADAVAEAVGGYIFPAYVFLNSNGGVLPYAGIVGAEELTQLIEAGLKAPSQPAPGSPANPGTAPATPTA